MANIASVKKNDIVRVVSEDSGKYIYYLKTLEPYDGGYDDEVIFEVLLTNDNRHEPGKKIPLSVKNYYNMFDSSEKDVEIARKFMDN